MDEMFAIPAEKITIRSYDGKKLCALYYHVAENAPVQIEFHGYKGNYLRDFCGGNKLARTMGHNTLVVHQRSHVDSDGRTISFGIKERKDCLSWINYACKRFGNDTPIFLSGISMGAATVLMTLEFNLPSNVIGVIADCPYSSPKEIIKKVAKDIGYPPNLFFPFIWLGGFIYGHFNVSAARATDAVKKSQIPILIIHGEDDRFVPCEMSRKIHEANKEKIRLVTVPNAGHGLSYMIDSDKYTKEVKGFINTLLEKFYKEKR
jgi:pimeloyl-ACP methyl ester carboxylesterase